MSYLWYSGEPYKVMMAANKVQEMEHVTHFALGFVSISLIQPKSHKWYGHYQCPWTKATMDRAQENAFMRLPGNALCTGKFQIPGYKDCTSLIAYSWRPLLSSVLEKFLAK